MQVARKRWRFDGGVCWVSWMAQTIASKANRYALSYFANLLSEFPLTYHSGSIGTVRTRRLGAKALVGLAKFYPLLRASSYKPNNTTSRMMYNT